MTTTNIIGTIKDSGNNPLTGTLTVKLAGNLVDRSTTPDSLLTRKGVNYPITNGVVNINLQDTVSPSTTYNFNFKDAEGTVWLDFDAIVPDGLGNPIEFSNLIPTGITNDTLATGAIRVATLLTSDPRFSEIVRPIYSVPFSLSGVTTTQTFYIPKPFAGGIKPRQLSGLILSGFANWGFDVGVVKADGTDEILPRPTTTVTTASGRNKFDQVYTLSRPSDVLGLIVRLTPSAGATALNGSILITFSEIQQ